MATWGKYFATKIFLCAYVTTVWENSRLLSLSVGNASMVILYTVWSDLITTSRNRPQYAICVRLYIVNTVINLCQTESFSHNWKLPTVCQVINPYLTKICNIYHINFRFLWVFTNPVIVCCISGVGTLIMSCSLYNYFFDDNELKCRRYSINFLHSVIHCITLPNTL